MIGIGDLAGAKKQKSNDGGMNVFFSLFALS
jgi:hypothetical protein